MWLPMSTCTMDELRFARCWWLCSLMGYDTLPITKAPSSPELFNNPNGITLHTTFIFIWRAEWDHKKQYWTCCTTTINAHTYYTQTHAVFDQQCMKICSHDRWRCADDIKTQIQTHDNKNTQDMQEQEQITS